MKGQSVGVFVSGVIFGAGLGLAGMTQPAKVIAFLDVTEHWDASLAFVMLGAIGVHATFLALFSRRVPGGDGVGAQAPAVRAKSPTVDLRLVIGSAIFGIGWGMAGFCPGPAVVSVVTGWRTPLLFVGAMLVGMGAHALAFGRRAEDAGGRAVERACS